MTDYDLEGRIAIVTGGGSGLGRAVSRTLAASGACVFVCDIDADRAEETVSSIKTTGLPARAVHLDVTSVESCLRGVDVVLQEHRRIDILVNSAGIDVTLPVTELSVDDWQRVRSVNLDGPFYMSKAVAPHMIAQGGGSIVNVASTAAKRAWPNASAYQASKWGVLGLSHALHAELRCHDIRVTAVIPGGMRTPFLLDRFEGIDESTLQDPAAVAETIKFVLCQPAGTVIPEVMVLPMREPSWP